MSERMDRTMRPHGTGQSVADRVAETLNILHDFPPLQPTGTAMEKIRKKEAYEPKDERDISMVTKVSKGMVYAVAFGKALEITDPCEARAKFTEQYQRSARSEGGWGIDKSIEMIKAARPNYEEEGERSRWQRLKGIIGR